MKKKLVIVLKIGIVIAVSLVVSYFVWSFVNLL